MPGDADILESWKEIAGYLKRDVTTVQRWEKREGLPVHRHVHDKSGSVFARKSELDQWRRARTRVADLPADAPPPAEGADPDTGDAPAAAPGLSAAARSALFAIGLTVLMLTVGALAPRRPDEAPATIAFAVDPGDGLTLVPGEAPMISPDGRSLVLVALGDDGITRLVLRPLSELATRTLPGTEGARHPFWSADSRQVAFFADGRLKALSPGGGEPRAICEAPYGQAGSWNADGVILFPLSARGGLYRVRAEGGTPQRVTEPDAAAGDFAHRAPHFLPDQHRFVYLVKSTSPDHEGIRVGALDGAAPRPLMRTLSEAWHASGHLLFVQPPALMAHPVDPVTLVPRGAPTTLSRDAAHESGTGRGLFSVSTTGTVAYAAIRTPLMGLVTLGRDGRRAGSRAMHGAVWDLAPAPRGDWLALTRLDPGETGRDIWLVDRRTTATLRVTRDAADDAMPVWSPQGDRLAFSSRRFGDFDIFVTAPAAGAPSAQLIAGQGDQWVNDWSSDGQWLLYSATIPGNTTRSDVFAYHLETRVVRAVVQTPGRDTQARFSPDGRWIAYSSDAPGQPAVLVRRFPPGAGDAPLTVGGGGYPRWRADGRELFYIDGSGTLMAAVLELDAVPRVGSQQVVARGVMARLGPAISGVGADYAPSADGSSFLLKEPLEAVAGRVTVLLHGLGQAPP